MMSAHADPQLMSVPIFPLPNVVLLPRAVLPLHIFEERYRLMMADVLAGSGQFAMALLKSGWEKKYYQRPEIEPVVCLGQVLTYEELPDGNYNLLLQGRLRARVLREHPGKAYRIADLQPLAQTNELEIDLEHERERLEAIFSARAVAGNPLIRQFKDLLSGPTPTSDVADLAAFNLLEDLPFKQTILAEPDVRHRISLIADALEEWASHINPALEGLPTDPSIN